MIKTAFAAAAAAVTLAPAAALAGPYVNIEANSGFTGSDYTQTQIDNHIGYESSLGTDASWYIQGGPSVVLPDGADSTTELSGKVGLSVAATDNLNVYGEVAAITQGEMDFDQDLNVCVKLGVKYAF